MKYSIFGIFCLAFCITGCLPAYHTGISHDVTPRPSYGSEPHHAANQPNEPKPNGRQPNENVRPAVSIYNCNSKQCEKGKNCYCEKDSRQPNVNNAPAAKTNPPAKPNTSATGKTCYYNTDCGVGGRCIVPRGQRMGNCSN